MHRNPSLYGQLFPENAWSLLKVYARSSYVSYAVLVLLRIVLWVELWGSLKECVNTGTRRSV